MTGPVEAGAEDFQTKVASFVRENRLCGAAAGVVHGGQLVWSGGAGFADAAGGRAAGPDVLYRIASVTKTFTGTAVMQLRDAGLLDLDDPVVKWIPELSDSASPAGIGAVTIRRLLSHESGLVGEPPGTDFLTAEPRYEGLASRSLERAGEIFAAVPPNAQTKYSNLGYQMLGEIVQRASGIEYPQYIRDRILMPLSMSSTGFEPLVPELAARRATGYAARAFSDELSVAPAMPLLWAEGGLWSTVEDLGRWLSFQLAAHADVLYIVYSLIFLVIGGIEATIIRIQLIVPHNHFVSPEVFNRMMTMHGTTMIFFVAMPILFGFGTYLIPLMIGARDMAFPRLNAFSFWMTAFGGLLLYFSFVGGNGLYGAGNAPDVGWWAYAPLTSRAFSVGHSTDFWTLALLVSGVGSIGTAVNFITTILCMRCPGMTLGKMPLLAWLNLVMGGMVILAVSPLTAAQVMLCIDRYLGGHFFDTQAGGSAVLWMHFFWIFGHPEVYVLIIPAFAFLSEIIPVFSRKPIFGYPVMVAATVCIGFVSLSVWAHHMFTVGMNSYANSFFTITTMAVGVPTGIKIFNWLGTMWGGKIQFRAPMLFCVGFLFQFLIAGLTGIMLGASPFNWQLSGSYFVVAHFHYVIVGGILFALFGAFYYWFPKMSGRMYNEVLAKCHFWLFLIGFHMTFDFMHIPGILGMPRRIYTYEPGRGWEIWNLIVTIGVVFQAAGVLVFVVQSALVSFQG